MPGVGQPFTGLFRGNVLLADVGRVADHGVERRDVDGPGLAGAQAAGDDAGGQVHQRPAGLDVEEVAPRHLRVVLLVDQVAGGEVDRRQVGGEAGQVHAVEVAEAAAVIARRVKLALAGVGADEERAAPARRVHDPLAAGADGKGVHQVYDLCAGVVLAVLVALLGADEPLEDRADDLVVDLGEVELVDLLDELPPVGDGRVGVEGDARGDRSVAGGAEDGLVVARDLTGPREEPLQVQPQRVAGGDVLGHDGGEQFSWVAADQRLVEDALVDQGVVGEAGRVLQVGRHAALIVRVGYLPALLVPHPGPQLLTLSPALPNGREGISRQQDRLVEGGLECVDEAVIGSAAGERPALGDVTGGVAEEAGDKPADRPLRLLEPHLLGAVDVRPQLPRLVKVVRRAASRLRPRLRRPENELVDVPGKAESALCLRGLASGVVDDFTTEGRVAVRPIGHLDLARQQRAAALVGQRQVASFDAAGGALLDAGVAERQRWIGVDRLLHPRRGNLGELQLVHCSAVSQGTPVGESTRGKRPPRIRTRCDSAGSLSLRRESPVLPSSASTFTAFLCRAVLGQCPSRSEGAGGARRRGRTRPTAAP